MWAMPSLFLHTLELKMEQRTFFHIIRRPKGLFSKLLLESLHNMINITP